MGWQLAILPEVVEALFGPLRLACDISALLVETRWCDAPLFGALQLDAHAVSWTLGCAENLPNLRSGRAEGALRSGINCRREGSLHSYGAAFERHVMLALSEASLGRVEAVVVSSIDVLRVRALSF